MWLARHLLSKRGIGSYTYMYPTDTVPHFRTSSLVFVGAADLMCPLVGYKWPMLGVWVLNRAHESCSNSI